MVQNNKQNNESSSQCLVVMYHYVHDSLSGTHGGKFSVRGTSTSRIPGLSVSDFNTQIDDLCRTMEPIDWPTMYAWLDGRADIPRRSFLLSFDDGLAEHARIVLPILEEKSIRGLFFVPGSVLTKYKMLCAHAIHLLLATLGDQPLYESLREYLDEHSEPVKNGQPSVVDELDHYVNSLDDEALKMYHYETPTRAGLKYFLTMRLPLALRREAVDSLFEKHVGSSKRWAKRWYLGWDDMVDMYALGHTIGGHSFSHEPLNGLSTQECVEELCCSAELLNEGLGPDVRPVSYPYGRIPKEVQQVCKQSGFVHGFTTESRMLNRCDDVFLLPRVDTIHVKKFMSETMVCP